MSTGSAHEIDLLVSNIWLRPPPLIDGQTQRAARLAECLRGEYDAIVLCEAFDEQLGPQLFLSLLEEYPFQTGAIDPDDGFEGPDGIRKLWNGGVAILSRWPLSRMASRSFGGLLGHPDSHANKGVLYARIDKLGRSYNIFGTHTQAAPELWVRLAYRLAGRDAEQRYLELRQAQFDVIRDFVAQQQIPDSEPVVIAGDLNVDRLGDRHQFEMMLERLDARFPDQTDGHPCTIDPLNNPLASGGRTRWLDYLLWSRSYLQPESTKIEARPLRGSTPWRRYPFGRRYYDLSDHFAVRGRFTFPADP